MALVVQKYGGTSVGSIEKIKNVARRVARTYDEGNDMVVVVSAMAGETNKLVALAEEMCEFPSEREYNLELFLTYDSNKELPSLENRFSRSSNAWSEPIGILFSLNLPIKLVKSIGLIGLSLIA